MSLLYYKSLHIIFVVTWFAGLFYIVRLFIYHTEASKKTDPERKILSDQFMVMERRLWYGITWPSMIGTVVFGSLLLTPYLKNWSHAAYLWLELKLALVLGLICYHLYCGHIFRQLQVGNFAWSSNRLRVLNEVATLFLVAIVFLVILKSAMALLQGLAGLILFAAVLMAAIMIYRRYRKDA
jgi:putative membrane protein